MKSENRPPFTVRAKDRDPEISPLSTAAKMAAVAGAALLVGSALSVIWEWLCVDATQEFFSQHPNHPDRPVHHTPTPSETAPVNDSDGSDANLDPATILVPLKGGSENSRRSISSLLSQDYPEFSVIVGVHESDARAIHLVKQLQTELPPEMHRNLKLVAAPNVLGGRPKAGNLYNALQFADTELLAMIDADVLAGPNLLRNLLPPLSEPGVGLTTCIYRAGIGGNFWDRMDALWNSTTYLPSALFGRRVIGDTFAFGAAIGIRRSVLEESGGFAAIAPRVGDDYQLGRNTASLGYRVHFVPHLVTELVKHTSPREFLSRRVRWTRTIRTFQPAGYAGSIITHGVPMAIGAALLSPQRKSRWVWLLALTANRVWCAHLNRRLLEPGAPLIELSLVPIRDIGALIVWIFGFTNPVGGPTTGGSGP